MCVCLSAKVLLSHRQDGDSSIVLFELDKIRIIFSMWQILANIVLT